MQRIVSRRRTWQEEGVRSEPSFEGNGLPRQHLRFKASDLCSTRIWRSLLSKNRPAFPLHPLSAEVAARGGLHSLWASRIPCSPRGLRCARLCSFALQLITLQPTMPVRDSSYILQNKELAKNPSSSPLAIIPRQSIMFFLLC